MELKDLAHDLHQEKGKENKGKFSPAFEIFSDEYNARVNENIVKKGGF